MPWKEMNVSYKEGEETKTIKVIAKDGEGNPIWVHENDGKEVGVDAQHYFSTIPKLINDKRALKDERTNLQAELKSLKEKFEDLDPEKAREALKTIQNLSDKKLIDAKKVDELRAQLKDEYDKALEKKTTEHSDVVNQLKHDLDISRGMVHNLTISNAFKGSSILNGPEKKVTIPVEMAEEYWGKYFKPEDVEGKVRPVAYIGDKPIYSSARPGELASFDEAIMTIIEMSPFKNDILKGTGASGGGANGSGQEVNDPSTKPADVGSYTKLSDFKSMSEKQAYIDKYGHEKYMDIVRESRKLGETLKEG